jgi:hypothetical protein
MNRLAILTVNFQNYTTTQKFLASFTKISLNKYKIFLTDLSPNKKTIKRSQNLEVIQERNKGYAFGINLGIKQAISQGFGKFVVINNDTRVSPSFVTNILESLDKHPSSIIGGKIYYEKSFEYHKNRYTKQQLGTVIWFAGGLVDWKNVITKHVGVDEVDTGKYEKFIRTDFITGCLMCFDKQVVDKVGYFDESYFLYYEDADYCERTKQNNISLYYDPSIVIWHQNAQSTGGSGSKLHLKYQERNRLKFGLKYAPFKTKLHLLKNSII